MRTKTICLLAGAVVLDAASDDQVLLQAIELTTPTPSNEIPAFATFYSAQHSPISKEPWPPLPAEGI
ncbi:MAG: hypothetical protein ACRED1_06665 [Limisphaerales bacterium]